MPWTNLGSPTFVNVSRNERRKWCQSYPAVASSVPRARSEVARFAADVGARLDTVEAIRLATSEAVTNVVLHSQDSSSARVRVDAAINGGALSMLVSDDGGGLRPRFDRSGLGLGLALIAQASDELEVIQREDGSTELRMRFGLD
jgi:anti-sigma regulatory factor (Ser/Thr protein kinase)